MLDIIHGDIKPENVLVFSDESKGYRVEICDFGYSTIGLDDGFIHLPNSWPWTAPEYHRRGFTLSDAKKTDLYSLGLVCIWLLSIANTKDGYLIALDNDAHHEVASMHGTAQDDYQWIDKLRISGALQTFIDHDVDQMIRFSGNQKRDLKTFLKSALHVDPSRRCLKLAGTLELPVM